MGLYLGCFLLPNVKEAGDDAAGEEETTSGPFLLSAPPIPGRAKPGIAPPTGLAAVRNWEVCASVGVATRGVVTGRKGVDKEEADAMLRTLCLACAPYRSTWTSNGPPTCKRVKDFRRGNGRESNEN